MQKILKAAECVLEAVEVSPTQTYDHTQVVVGRFQGFSVKNGGESKLSTLRKNCDYSVKKIKIFPCRLLPDNGLQYSIEISFICRI